MSDDYCPCAEICGFCIFRRRNDAERDPVYERVRESYCHPGLVTFGVFFFFFTFIFCYYVLFDGFIWMALLVATLAAMAVMSISLFLKRTRSSILPKSDFSKPWNRLDPRRQLLWMKLGFDQEKWDNRQGRSDPTANVTCFTDDWDRQPAEIQAAARELGFDSTSWELHNSFNDGQEFGEDASILELPGHFRGMHYSGEERYPIERGQPWLVVIVSAELAVINWMVFSLFSLVFFFGYHNLKGALVVLTVALVVVLCVLSGMLPKRYMSLGLDPKGRWLLRFIALFIVFGSLAGFSLSSDALRDYWPYYSMRHYTNVAPDEPASAHEDASAIVFMRGSRPDVNRAIGYHRQGHTYCVAPVSLEAPYSDDDSQASSDVQYWVVGLDCCSGTEGFSCGESKKSTAHSGIVSSKERTIIQDLFQGNLLTDMSFFEEAIKMNMAKFDLTSPDEHLLVKWVGDIQKATDKTWKDALVKWFVYEMYGLLAALVCGLFVPVLLFRDEFSTHLNASRAKFFKAANYPMGEWGRAFNDD